MRKKIPPSGNSALATLKSWMIQHVAVITHGTFKDCCVTLHNWGEIIFKGELLFLSNSTLYDISGLLILRLRGWFQSEF